MLALARLQGNDIPLISGSYTQTQNQIDNFTLELPLSEIPDFNDLLDQDIAVYWQSNLLVSGKVTEMPLLQFDKQGRQTAKLECEGEITRLTALPAKISNAHYQDQTITSIVSDLLAYANTVSGLNWQITDISTMPDPAIKTTVDLRGKSTLYSQLVETVKSGERLFFRFAGYNSLTNTYELHLGAFGAFTTQAYQHDNIIDEPRMNRGSTKPIKIIEPIGGRSADAPVTLAEATIVPNPSYPIQIIAGRYVVNNTLTTKGAHIVEFFDVHKTRNEENADFDTTRRQEAANALYQRAIRYLQKTKPYVEIDVRVAVADTPLIGDKIWLRAKVSEPIYDPVTEESRLIPTASLDGLYTMTSIKMNFLGATAYDHFTESGFFYTLYDIRVTDNEYIGVKDDSLELYDKLERFNGSDIITSPVATRGTFYVTVTHDEALDLPDCGAPLGKSFTFALPAIPTGSTVVYAVVMSVTAGHTYIIIQNPALPVTPLVLCVDEGTWGVAPLDIVSITVRYDFI